MDLKQVRSFLAVAKTLNFSRAARQLYLSQPALSTQIKALEAHLGACLLLRNRRTVTLTAVGKAFLADAEALLQQVDDVEMNVRRMSLGETGHLRIGFVASATLDLVPAVALAFRKHYPGVSLDLKNMPTVRQIEALRSGTLDAGFLRLPIDEPDLKVSLVSSEAFVLILPRSHPLSRKPNLQLADLASEPFVTYAESLAPAFFQRWAALCRAAGFVPNIVQNTAEMDTTIALVAAGLGVAILPEGITRRNRRFVSVHALPRQKVRSEIGVAYLSARQTPLLTRLSSIARQVGQRSLIQNSNKAGSNKR